MASRKISVEIVGDTKSLDRAFGRAGNQAGAFQAKMGSATSGLKTLGKVAGVAAGGAALGGIAVVLRQGFSEWQASAKAIATTNAILKATGGVANVTAKDMDRLTTSLLEKTGVDDELIRSGANLLLTFKNVRNEAGKGNAVFNRATAAALDLSQAGFGSVESASKMLGKALNDPIKGMTALGRAGVTFSEDQKKVIKSLTESGDLLGAQRVILKEVESQVGGTAEAIGDTLPGQINKAREQFNNLSGTIVGGLAPAMTKGLGAVNSFLAKFSEADGVGAKFRVVMDTIKSSVTAGAQAIVQGFRSVNWGEVGRTLADGARATLDFLVRTLQSINWGEVGRTVGELLIRQYNTLAQALNRVDWNNIGREAVKGLGRVLEAIGAFLAGVDWPAVIAALARGLAAALRALGGILLGIGQELGGQIMIGIRDGASALFALVKAWLATVPAQIQSLFSNAIEWLYNAGIAVLQGFLNGLQAKAIEVKNFLVGISEKIPNWKGPPSEDRKMLYSAGQLVMGGFLAGIESKADELATRLKAVGKGLSGTVVLGWLEGAGELPERVSETFRSALDSGKTRIDESRQGFAAMFSTLATDSLSAFDANAQTTLNTLSTKFEGLRNRLDAELAKTLSKLDAAVARSMREFDRQGAQLTPAERELRRLQEGHAAGGRLQALEEAQQALTDAQAAGDPEAILRAQRAVSDAQYAITIANLERRAEKEREELNASIERQRTHLTNVVNTVRQKEIDKTAEEQKGINERQRIETLNLNATIENDRRRLELSLKALATMFEKRGILAAEATEKIMELLAEYDIDFKSIGHNMGVAWIKGFRESVIAATKGSATLSKVFDDVLSDLLEIPVKKLSVAKKKQIGDVAAGFNSQTAAKLRELYARLAPGGGGTGGLAPQTAGLLSTIQRTFGGVTLTSGHRSPEQNAAVQGAPNSDHLSGRAIDLVPSAGWSDATIALFDRIAAWAASLSSVRWIGWRGVRGHGPGDHLHISTFDQGGWLPPKSKTLAINNTRYWEPVGPPGRGGGGMNISVTVNGWVGNDQDLAGRVVDAINRQQRVGRLRFSG